MFSYVSYSIKNIINIQEIIQVFSKEYPFGYVDHGEKHNFWEFVYVESGEVEVRSDDDTYKLISGDIFFHQPNEFHSIHILSQTPARIYFISFFCNSRAMDLFKKLKLSLPSRIKNLLYTTYNEGINTFELKDESDDHTLIPSPHSPIGGQQLYRIYLESFLINILRLLSDKKNSHTFTTKEELYSAIIKKATDYMSSNIYSDFRIENLCQHLNYSRTFLSSKFKEYVGVSIMQYYNYLKINEAKRLIAEKKYSFTKIAEMLNFENQYYFSQVFRKYAKITPTDYKRQMNK